MRACPTDAAWPAPSSLELSVVGPSYLYLRGRRHRCFVFGISRRQHTLNTPPRRPSLTLSHNTGAGDDERRHDGGGSAGGASSAWQRRPQERSLRDVRRRAGAARGEEGGGIVQQQRGRNEQRLVHFFLLFEKDGCT